MPRSSDKKANFVAYYNNKVTKIKKSNQLEITLIKTTSICRLRKSSCLQQWP